MATHVSDLSIEELRTVIRETVRETIVGLLSDPDEGLELQEEFKEQLQRSVDVLQGGGETLSAESVAARLGLTW